MRWWQGSRSVLRPAMGYMLTFRWLQTRVLSTSNRGRFWLNRDTVGRVKKTSFSFLVDTQPILPRRRVSRPTTAPTVNSFRFSQQKLLPL